jgi:hypothetical protein
MICTSLGFIVEPALGRAIAAAFAARVLYWSERAELCLKHDGRGNDNRAIQTLRSCV